MNEWFWQELEVFIQHLRKILIVVIAFSIVSAVLPLYRGLTFTSLVIQLITYNFLPEGVEVIPIGWFQPATIYLYMSLLLGVMLSIPYAIYQLSRYISPALNPHEKILLWNLAKAFPFLIFGLIWGWYLIVPLNIRALLFFNEVLFCKVLSTVRDGFFTGY